MRIFTLHSALRVFAIVLGISAASQASARYFHHSTPSSQYRMVKIEYAPTVDLSFLGTYNVPNSSFEGMMRIPITGSSAIITKTGLYDGGNEGDDDTTSGGDTSDGDHGHHDGDNDSSGDHGHDGGMDSTGGHGHDGDNDSTGNAGDNDSTGDHNGDTTNMGDHGHDGNDTVECGHHGHADNDDSTNVNDTAQHALFNGGHQSIVIKSHGHTANVTFLFTNNLATNVTITGMSLTTGKNFTITGGAPTLMKPAKLAPGASISLKVAFNAMDYVVHTDQLQVTSNSAQTPTTIALQGILLAAASVSNTLPSGVSITLLPNPMTSRLKVDLSGVSNASAAIYDMTGKEVLSTSISSNEWIWNGTANDGSSLLSGTYLVRLSGTSTDGASFVSTQKIILAR